MKTFGDKLTELRLDKKFSLRRAAKEIGISAKYLSEIETGTKIPNRGVILISIADFYDVYIDELLWLAHISELKKDRMERNKKKIKMKIPPITTSNSNYATAIDVFTEFVEDGGFKLNDSFIDWCNERRNSAKPESI